MHCWLWLSLAIGPIESSIAISKPLSVRVYEVGSWRVVETESFRIHSRLPEQDALELAEQCEFCRSDLVAVWIGRPNEVSWTPKCDVYLHATIREYNVALGQQGNRSVGSTRMKFDRGAPSLRRIDLRADAADWLTGALPHELTHVVLGDVFGGRSIPRWADEGLAMLAESNAKKHLRMAHLRQAVTNRSIFTTSTLLSLQSAPQPHMIDAFYGQSAAVVSLLVAEHGPRKFMEFLKRSHSSGRSAALREVYGFASDTELQALWNSAIANGTAFDLVDLRECLSPQVAASSARLAP